MDIVARLISFRDFTGLSNSQFADKAGIPRPTLSQFLSGRNKRLSDDLASKIHNAFPELNMLWLLFGEGDMETGANIRFSEPENTAFQPLFADETSADQEIASSSLPSDIVPNIDSNRKNDAFSGNSDSIIPDTPLETVVAGSSAQTDTAKRIQSIMVFYTDNSYEIFTPGNK